MPTRIPLPGLPGQSFMQGLQSGSDLFSNIMRPILAREQMSQRQNQFIEDQKRRQAQFAQDFALRQSNADREMSLQPFRQRLLEQQILGAQQKNDPNYEWNKFSNIANKFGGMDPNTLKNNPILRGFFKNQFGFDPLNAPQTPEEKQAAELDLFKKKQAIKDEKKNGSIATNKVLTQNQQAVQAIDTVLPMLDDLIDHPKKIYGFWDFSPSKKAAYNAKTGSMIDMLVAAQSLPQVKESVELVKEQVRRGSGEGDNEYIKRLKDFKKDLIARRIKSAGVVNSKKVNSNNITLNETVHLIGPNGEDYDVPPNEVDAIISQHPGVRRG